MRPPAGAPHPFALSLSTIASYPFALSLSKGAALCLGFLLLLLTINVADAQPLDEATIRQRIYTGRFDELKVLEAASAQGDPVAMHWWGSLVGNCIYGACERETEKALTRKSASAGYSQARVAILRNAGSAQELEALVGEIGPPRGALEQSAYVLMLATYNVPGAVEQFAALNRNAVAEGTLFPLLTKISLEGSKNQEPLLRALAEAGTDKALQLLIRHQVLYKGMEGEQVMAQALSGDRLLALAQCGTLRTRTNKPTLPAKLLPLCEQAAQEGYPAALDALIAHHLAAPNLVAARHYADLCERLYAAHCAENAADVYQALAMGSPTPDLVLQLDYWNAVAGGAADTSAQRPTQLVRRIYATRVRNAFMLRDCNASKYDVQTQSFEIAADCPWRKKVAIAPQYLGAR